MNTRHLVGVGACFFLPALSAVAGGESQKLLHPLGTDGDHFGHDVSVDSLLAVVGVTGDDTIGDRAGAAIVFRRDGTGLGPWDEVQSLHASDAETGDEFGTSVSISGEFAAVGAPFESTFGIGSGAVYLFRRDAGGVDNWGEVAKLTASDASLAAQFGWSVDIDGDTLIVGAFLDDEMAENGGAAYIFQRDHGGPDAWGELTKIVHSGVAANDYFGFSVCLNGDTAVVGALFDTVFAFSSGSATVFERHAGGTDAWGQVVQLAPTKTGPQQWYGFDVGIHQDTICVGVPGDDDGGVQAGAAYVYERNNGGQGAWGLSKKLTALSGHPNDQFGETVSVNGDLVAIGAPRADDLCGGGGPADCDSGAAYLFRRNAGFAGPWGQVATLTAFDGQSADFFGHSVAMGTDLAVVGSIFDDDAGDASGSAYVWETPKIPLCPGDANTDTVVDLFDISFVIFRLGSQGNPGNVEGDTNFDGEVDSSDIANVIFRLDSSCD